MKSNLIITVGICTLAWCCCAKGQSKVREADLCEIAAHPMDYTGQMVQIRGELESTMEAYVIAKSDCAAIPLEHPELVTPRPDFVLQKNAAYKKLEKMLRANGKQMQCLGPCPKGPYYVPITATLVGRVDTVPESDVQGSLIQRRGFGNAHRSTVRIIVESYSEVEGHIRPDSPAPASPLSTVLHKSGHVDPAGGHGPGKISKPR
jgi:hypothetical protein